MIHIVNEAISFIYKQIIITQTQSSEKLADFYIKKIAFKTVFERSIKESCISEYLQSLNQRIYELEDEQLKANIEKYNKTITLDN